MWECCAWFSWIVQNCYFLIKCIWSYFQCKRLHNAWYNARISSDPIFRWWSDPSIRTLQRFLSKSSCEDRNMANLCDFRMLSFSSIYQVSTANHQLLMRTTQRHKVAKLDNQDWFDAGTGSIWRRTASSFSLPLRYMNFVKYVAHHA